MTTCAVPGRQHEAEHGLQLCRNHIDEIEQWLTDVEDEWQRLDARPSMQANWDDARSGKLASHHTPARIIPIVLADPRRVAADDLHGPSSRFGLDEVLSAFDTLHSWAQMVRHGRELSTPGRWVTEHLFPGPVCRTCSHPSCRRLVHRYFHLDRQTVGGERQLLARHLEWIAEQPWAGPLWVSIRKLRNQLQAANGTGDLLVGSCPRCGGSLHIIEPRYTSGPASTGPTLWAAECDRDALHRWEGKEIIRLRLDLDEQKEQRQ